ncbi:hypothetical protein MA16_Dca020014 [Dendrobium catenatum]|uniref:Uncharacterized protein n=1 Tax=Dendrobium catenatum TaxID=906689 RepID=A0A2I0WZ87_9ASPA|nr:hypothetical protein MA16_Dca020014 [Dendrobium catenatum]
MPKIRQKQEFPSNFPVKSRKSRRNISKKICRKYLIDIRRKCARNAAGNQSAGKLPENPSLDLPERTERERLSAEMPKKNEVLASSKSEGGNCPPPPGLGVVPPLDVGVKWVRTSDIGDVMLGRVNNWLRKKKLAVTRKNANDIGRRCGILLPPFQNLCILFLTPTAWVCHFFTNSTPLLLLQKIPATDHIHPDSILSADPPDSTFIPNINSPSMDGNDIAQIQMQAPMPPAGVISPNRFEILQQQEDSHSSSDNLTMDNKSDASKNSKGKSNQASSSISSKKPTRGKQGKNPPPHPGP